MYPTTNLQPGQSGDNVIKLQKFLISQGMQIPSGATGFFGNETKAALTQWQKKMGVDTAGNDGYWGPRSIAAAKNPASVQNSSTPSSPAGVPASSKNTEDYNKVGDTLTSYYGQTKNKDWETGSLAEEKYVETAASQSGIIDPNFLSKISSDPSIIGFYVNALAYGGYTIGDILNDMKRREMISTGNTQAQGIKIIDPEMPRSEYQSSAEGQKSIGAASTLLSTFNMQGLMNPEIVKYGSDIPDELFKTLVPVLDNTSQAYKDAVANVKSAFYDIANQQLQATTEQAKSVADYNYETFKKDVEKKYGIVLSDDATKAWAQIEALESNYSERGIKNSGLKSEAVDDYLKSVRKQNQRTRDTKLSEEETQKASFYTASGTPAQIAGLTPEERQKWGLTPSADVLAQYDMANLKARFPDQSEEELKAYRDSVLDENNNYRSTLYSKYFSDIAKNKASKKSMAETQVLQDTLNKETAAYRNYDQSQPFSQASTKDNATVKQNASPNPPNQPVLTTSSTTGTEAAAKAASNISASINQYNSNTGAKLKENESYVNAQGQTITQGTPYVPYTPTPTTTQTTTQPITQTTPKTTTPTVTQPTVQPTKTTTQTPAKSGYQGVSIVDYLSSVGQDSSYSSRSKLATKNKIAGYAGTAEQNTQLLKILRGY